jgi:Hypothetical glycosyl hydrolase 6
MLDRHQLSTILPWIAASFLTVSACIGATKGEDQKAPGDATPKPWYERLNVGMEVGPTGAQFGSDPSDVKYAAKFSGAEIVARQRECGSEYLVIWARDGEYAYYDSKLAPKCPGLGSRDPLRETMEAARPQRLPVIAYCVVQADGYAWRKHPEWRMMGADGAALPRMCLRSGYLEHVKGLCSEMLAYGIDGFHIDMLDQGLGLPYGCWCPHCRKAFEKEFGHPMPKGATWDERWDEMLQFRYASSDQFEHDLYRHIKQVNAKATVDFNYHGNPPFSIETGQRPVQHAVNADFVTGETGVWGFSALGVGLNARFYAAATPGHPVQVAMQRGVRVYHDQTTRPVADLRWELFTLLAHGAFVTVVDKTAYDGTLDPVAYERLKAVFDEAKAKREHFGQPALPGVGIYFSHRSRDWIGREDPSQYWQAFHGAHQALVYEHIPWQIVLDENASAEQLAKLPVLLLPHTAILEDREVAMIRDYVTRGGKLIVAGWTASYDRMGRPRDSSALEDLIGAKLVRRLPSRDNSLRFSAQEIREHGPLLEGLRPDWWFLVEGPATVYQPTKARPIGQLLKPHRTVRQQQGKEGTDWPMSADEPVGPAVLLNRVGAGCVLTFAGSPDWATASEHRLPEARRLIRGAVRLLWPSPLIEVQAPLNVETVVTQETAARTLRVHFLGYLAPAVTTPPKNRPYVLPALIEEAPMYQAEINCRLPVASAKAFSPQTKLEIAGNRLRLLIHDIHEVVTIQCADAAAR